MIVQDIIVGKGNAMTIVDIGHLGKDNPRSCFQPDRTTVPTSAVTHHIGRRRSRQEGIVDFV
jgi:hypothetical protein